MLNKITFLLTSALIFLSLFVNSFVSTLSANAATNTPITSSVKYIRGAKVTCNTYMQTVNMVENKNIIYSYNLMVENCSSNTEIISSKIVNVWGNSKSLTWKVRNNLVNQRVTANRNSKGVVQSYNISTTGEFANCYPYVCLGKKYITINFNGGLNGVGNFSYSVK